MFRTWETDITDEVWMLNIPLFFLKTRTCEVFEIYPFLRGI